MSELSILIREQSKSLTSFFDKSNKNVNNDYDNERKKTVTTQLKKIKLLKKENNIKSKEILVSYILKK
jgi:hypothetical protein